MKLKKLFIPILVIVSGIGLAYVWFGFLYPDPYYHALYSTVNKIKYLWTPLILLPLIYLFLILIMTLKNRKIKHNLASLLLAFFVFFLIIYPVLDLRYFYNSRNESKHLGKIYHPYLQLVPNDDPRLNSNIENGHYKIFCLGGSTTEFKDNQGTGWPERLEKYLRKVYNTDSISVYNFGKQWYTTLHSLINYESNLRQHKPDMILLMHNINDLLQNADFSYLSNGPFRGDYGHFYGPTKDILKKHGLFGSFISKFSPMWYYRDQRITVEQDSFPGIASFTRNIYSLIDLASIDKTKVVLLTQPNIYTRDMNEKMKSACIMVNFEAVGKHKKWGYYTAFTGMQQYNKRIREISSIKNVNLIDLEKYIPKTLEYFNDDVHYNDITFDIISRVLADEIVKSNVLPFKSSGVQL